MWLQNNILKISYFTVKLERKSCITKIYGYEGISYNSHKKQPKIKELLFYSASYFSLRNPSNCKYHPKAGSSTYKRCKIFTCSQGIFCHKNFMVVTYFLFLYNNDTIKF